MRQRILLFLLPVLLLVVGVVLFTTNRNTQATSPNLEDIGATFSSDRLRWEWERQRDPATGKIPENIREREIAFAAHLPSRDGSGSLLKGSGIATYSWAHRGPWNVGGRTRALAYDITGEDTIIAGGASGGIWRSSDGGASWVLTTSPDQALGATTLVQDVREGKRHIWYYGTGEGFNSASGSSIYARYLGDGIFKSTDNGRSWTQLSSSKSGSPQTLNPADITWRLAIDPSNSSEDIVYAAIYGSIFRSPDGGETWKEVLKSGSSFGSPSFYSDIAVTPTGVVYATLSSEGRKKGIFRSENGIDFTDITPNNFPKEYNRMVIGLAPSNENTLYILGETPGSGAIGRNFLGEESFHSLWKYSYISGNGTGDGGLWEDRSANLPQYGSSFGDFHSQGGYDLLARVKPDDENVLFIGGTNLYRSTDGFATSENTAWIGGYRNVVLNIGENAVIEHYGYPGQHPDQHEVVFSPTNPNVMLSGNDGGVYKAPDALSDSIKWISLNNGYLTTQFYAVAIDRKEEGSQMIIGGTQDNGTWRNNGGGERDAWEFTGSGDGAYAAVTDGGKYLYVSKQRGRIYRVELDEAMNVTGSTRIDPEVENSEFYRFINPLVIDPNDANVMYIPYSRNIWRNRDVTAIPLDNKRATAIGWDSLGNTAVTSSVITTVGVSDQNPSHRLWYGTGNATLFRLDDALGENPIPVEVTSPLFPANGYTSCIAVDPEDGDHAVAVFSNYSVVSLFETTDAGETWQSVSGNLEENQNGTGSGPSCRWVTILHRGAGTLYLVGTSVGLFTTTSLRGDETIWVKEGAESIGNVVVDMVDGRSSDGFVAVATHGAGIYSTTVGLLGVDGSKGREVASSIERIVPNPITDRGSISFRIGGTTNKVPMQLDLYDLRGVRVKQLLSGVRSPGEYREEFDVADMPSGLYLCHLVIGEERFAKRIVIAKE
ncbi:MAG: hypothetical protein KDD67_09615 [Ignavibacteriae bacterium]|nr:hypothetical protein [Ignavibacteriota bacterium]